MDETYDEQSGMPLENHQVLRNFGPWAKAKQKNQLYASTKRCDITHKDTIMEFYPANLQWLEKLW